MMTFGRQAGLGSYLDEKKQLTLEGLRIGKSYLTKSSSLKLPEDEFSFHKQAYVMGAYSRFEGYFLDVAAEMLVCFPKKLKNSDMKLHDFIDQQTDFLSAIVDKQTDSMGYKRFDDILETVMSYFSRKPLSSPAQPIVQEFKATRDIYVHNGGRWNTIYFQKAGANARPEPQSHILPLDDVYLQNATDALINLVVDFDAAGPQQYKRYNRSHAFREMWEAAALERIIPFEQAWAPDLKGDVVRPKDYALDWGWSSSEKYLYDFFLSIFSKDHPKITSTLQQAIERWPIQTPSGQMIKSWLDAPFSF